MKNNFISRWIPLVVLLISVNGYANDLKSQFLFLKKEGLTNFSIIDTVPGIRFYIPSDSLPALLNDSIVGITLEQMDFLSSMKLDCDGVYAQAYFYEAELDTAFTKIEQRDSIIADFQVQNGFQFKEINEQDRVIGEMDTHISELEADLNKQKQKTKTAWISGGVITAILAGIAIFR